MPKILNEVRADFMNNPELKIIKNQKKEAHRLVMSKIMDKIESQKDNPENMTYTAYFSNIVSDATKILIGETPEK